jgi:hypothetical protein
MRFDASGHMVILYCLGYDTNSCKTITLDLDRDVLANNLIPDRIRIGRGSHLTCVKTSYHIAVLWLKMFLPDLASR